MFFLNLRNGEKLGLRKLGVHLIGILNYLHQVRAVAIIAGNPNG